MATKKIDAEVAKRAKAMGLVAETEEKVREQLLDILAKNEIDGMEEEDTMTLIEIAESFYDGPAVVEPEEPTVGETEEELDALSAEVAAEDGVQEPEEPTEIPEEEENGEVGLEDMNRSELKKFIVDNELDIKVKKSMTDDDIRKAIQEAVEESEEPEEEPVSVPEKKQVKKESSKRVMKLDPKNNKADREVFVKALGEIFPEEEFEYAWLSTNGVTIKHIGKNGKRGVVLLENCTVKPDGIKCVLYLNIMTKHTDILEELDIDFTPCWNKAPMVKNITLDEAVEIIGQVKDTIYAAVNKIDKKLGENREKMETNLKNVVKKSKKTKK